MAAPEGLLEKVRAGSAGAGAGGEEDTDGDDLSPEAQAVKDMLDAHDRGDDEAAGSAFKRAYRICAASKGAPSEAASKEPDEGEDEEEY